MTYAAAVCFTAVTASKFAYHRIGSCKRHALLGAIGDNARDISKGNLRGVEGRCSVRQNFRVIKASPAEERAVYEGLRNFSVYAAELRIEGQHQTLVAAICEGDLCVAERFITLGGAPCRTAQRCAAIRQLYEFLHHEGISSIDPLAVLTASALENRRRDLPAQERWLRAWFSKESTRRVARHYMRRVIAEAIEQFNLPWDIEREQQAWDEVRMSRPFLQPRPNTYTDLIFRTPETFAARMQAVWTANSSLTPTGVEERRYALRRMCDWAALCGRVKNWNATRAQLDSRAGV